MQMMHNVKTYFLSIKTLDRIGKTIARLFDTNGIPTVNRELESVITPRLYFICESSPLSYLLREIQIEDPRIAPNLRNPWLITNDQLPN
jgi:hypothetical protein